MSVKKKGVQHGAHSNGGPRAGTRDESVAPAAHARTPARCWDGPRTASAAHIHLTGKWQKGNAWAAIKVLAPEWVIEMVEVFIKILTPLEEQELKLMDQLQEAARERKIPRGVGPLTFEILRREVGDWGRFNNRRQVSSSSLTSLIIGRQPRGTERAICFSGRHL
jgi:hypothetical protein